jgi:hypothetical protein
MRQGCLTPRRNCQAYQSALVIARLRSGTASRSWPATAQQAQARPPEIKITSARSCSARASDVIRQLRQDGRLRGTPFNFRARAHWHQSNSSGPSSSGSVSRHQSSGSGPSEGSRCHQCLEGDLNRDIATIAANRDPASFVTRGWIGGIGDKCVIEARPAVTLGCGITDTHVNRVDFEWGQKRRKLRARHRLPLAPLTPSSVIHADQMIEQFPAEDGMRVVRYTVGQGADVGIGLTERGANF